MFVVFISIILFFFIRVEQPLLRLVVRLLLVPVIAGVSYEIIRLAGRSNNIFVRIISAPGLWLQKLTTKEPDDDMIEVAIAAIEAVFDWKEYFKTEFNYDVDDAQAVSEKSQEIAKELKEEEVEETEPEEEPSLAEEQEES